MALNYAKLFNRRATPQSQPIPGSNQVRNSGSGFHPAQALRHYRSEFVGDAKAVVVGMTSNGFTLADPNDRGMLDVVGFDTTAPAVIADFVRNT